MSLIKLIETNQNGFRRKFTVEIDLINESDKELKALIKFLKSSNDNDNVLGCNYWLCELARIIENKD